MVKKIACAIFYAFSKSAFRGLGGVRTGQVILRGGLGGLGLIPPWFCRVFEETRRTLRVNFGSAGGSRGSVQSLRGPQEVREVVWQV